MGPRDWRVIEERHLELQRETRLERKPLHPEPFGVGPIGIVLMLGTSALAGAAWAFASLRMEWL